MATSLSQFSFHHKKKSLNSGIDVQRELVYFVVQNNISCMETTLKNENHEMAEQAQALLRNSFLICLLAGVIAMIGVSLQSHCAEYTCLWIALLVAAASLGLSFFLGFLFGIPKRNVNATDNYLFNNSLIEISEWLTKIIVGLGLVHLRKIPDYLDGMATYIVNTMSNCDSHSCSKVFFISVILYFCFVGLYHGYNHMRLVLSLKYKDADDELSKMKAEISELKVEKKVVENEAEELKKENATKVVAADHLLNLLNMRDNETSDTTNFMRTTYLANEAYMDVPDKVESVVSMMAMAESRYQLGLINNKDIDDPQKGMWGGLSEANGRKLRAKVTKVINGLYTIDVTVVSTDTNRPLLEDEPVVVGLHNTFVPAIQLKKVKNGEMSFSLRSLGSFTIGALMDEGKTELELDLAELPDVDGYFKTH